jgi:hypothetical protein
VAAQLAALQEGLSSVSKYAKVTALGMTENRMLGNILEPRTKIIEARK